MMFATFYAHQRKSWRETTLAVKKYSFGQSSPKFQPTVFSAINFVWNKVWEKAIQLGILIY